MVYAERFGFDITKRPKESRARKYQKHVIFVQRSINCTRETETYAGLNRVECTPAEDAFRVVTADAGSDTSQVTSR